MTCICKPWRGYHLAECPCQAAYEARRPPEPSDEDMAAARDLVNAGFVQVSRKYRRVFQLPARGSALECLERIDPARAARLREAAAQRLESEARGVVWALRLGEERELTPGEFEAFRRAAAEQGLP